MNTAPLVIAALVLSAAGAAFAADSAPAAATAGAAVTTARKPQTLTREQVIAEYLEARKNGTLIETEADMDVAQTRKHIAR